MGKTFFIDFDGTITKVDTCAAMVEAFAKDGWNEINKLWEEKKLSTEDCANLTFKLFDASLNDIKKLMYSIEIDEYFKSFIDICRQKGYKVYILSDGYDFNIKTILEKNNIDIPYYANRLIYESSFKIECPHTNSSCGRCGTCKTTLMNKFKEDGNKIIYIGDGYSDMCASLNADVVCAKGVLYEYCIKNGINAIYYNSFNDIISKILL